MGAFYVDMINGVLYPVRPYDMPPAHVAALMEWSPFRVRDFTRSRLFDLTPNRGYPDVRPLLMR